MLAACSGGDSTSEPPPGTPPGTTPPGGNDPDSGKPGDPGKNAATLSGPGAGGAKVAIDAAGNAIGVWIQEESSGKRHYWTSRFTVGTGWAKAVALESNLGDPDEPAQIAMAPNGMAMVVWRQLTSSTAHDVWARPYDPATGWGAVERIEDGKYHANSPLVGIDNAGNAIAAWPQDLDGAARFKMHARRFVRGTGWEPTPTTFTTPSPAGSMDGPASLAVSGNGDAFLVFKHEGAIWWARYAGNAWSTAAELVPDTGAYQSIGVPVVAADENGNAIVAWSHVDITSGSKSTVNTRRYKGGWQPPGLVGPAVDSDLLSHLRIAMSPNGSAALVWGRKDLSLQAATAPADGAWTVAELKAPSILEITSMPAIAIDGAGNAFTVWGQKTGEKYTADLYSSRFSGGAWSAAAIDEQTEQAAQDPAVAVNAAGDRAMLWTEWVENGGTQVFARYTAR